MERVDGWVTHLNGKNKKLWSREKPINSFDECRQMIVVRMTLKKTRRF